MRCCNLQVFCIQYSFITPSTIPKHNLCLTLHTSKSQTKTLLRHCLFVQATAVEKSYTAGFHYSCTSLFAKQYISANKNVTAAALCQAPQDFNKGSALVAYNSTSFYDDLLWSSAWLWHLTGGTLQNLLFPCLYDCLWCVCWVSQVEPMLPSRMQLHQKQPVSKFGGMLRCVKACGSMLLLLCLCHRLGSFAAMGAGPKTSLMISYCCIIDHQGRTGSCKHCCQKGLLALA